MHSYSKEHLWYRITLLNALLCLFLVSACNTSQAEPDANATESATVDPATTINNPQEEFQTSGQAERLVIWTPLFFAQPEEGPASETLSEIYRAFQDNNPGIELVIQPKAETGISSLENYIRSAKEVAPAILPDIILVETQQMWPMIEAFDIQPLATEEMSTFFDNIYPFAQEAVTFNQNIYGIPYVASIIHMVYNRQEFPNTADSPSIPTSWPNLLATETTYLFPAIGQNRLSSDMLLLQYVGAGGQLTSDGSIINPEALTALFNFMASGAESGIFPPENWEMSTYAATWERFVENQEGLVNVRSEQYLSQQDALTNLGFASIPARSGPTVTIGRVWAFVVITDDPDKRMLATSLIELLRSPEAQGRWSQSMNRLPTHMDAFNNWGTSQPYYDFLRQQMDIALAIPNGSAFAKLSLQLQTAEISVSSGEVSAQDAVSKIINSE